MAGNHLSSLLLSFSLFVFFLPAVPTARAAIGFNWGTLQSHRLSPSVVVNLLKRNKIEKVKLFDADPRVLRALRGSGIEVMVGIPNEMLALLSSSSLAADSWVAQNVSRYMRRGGVLIRYIAVGNEPFLTSYQGQYQSFIVPALTSLQQSLIKANLAGSIKLVVPCNADAYEGDLPSQGTFRPDIGPIMAQLLSFLSSTNSPFVTNIYPFLSLYQSKDFPQDYAFFAGSTHSVVDSGNTYSNAFEGNFDTLVSALTKAGYRDMPIIVGEIGWPTGGASSANISAARAFNQGLVNYVLSGKGTPLRPNGRPLDLYLFSLLDEDKKNIFPGNFERQWGVFSFDGQAKYKLNLGRGRLRDAEEVNYLPPRWCVMNPTVGGGAAMGEAAWRACEAVDCTELLEGGLCDWIGEEGNASYAFNRYYQMRGQDEESCDFDGMGMITYLDPSMGSCRFLVGLSDDSGGGWGLDGVFGGFWVLLYWGIFWI